MNDDYRLIVHPWTYLRLMWQFHIEAGRYSYVWKAEKDQTWADYQGFGINDVGAFRR